MNLVILSVSPIDFDLAFQGYNSIIPSHFKPNTTG